MIDPARRGDRRWDGTEGSVGRVCARIPAPIAAGVRLVKKVQMLSIVLLLMAVLGFSQTAVEAKVLRLVDSFMEYYETAGKDAAFAAAQDLKGRFADGELYLFIIDLECVTYVHAGMPALVGKNNRDVKDTDGIYFFREFVRVARENGVGWVEYRWSNPVSKKVERKRTFVKLIPGTTYVVGCGFYMGQE